MKLISKFTIEMKIPENTLLASVIYIKYISQYMNISRLTKVKTACAAGQVEANLTD